MNRRYLALAALGLLVVLAGCLGGGGPSKSQLNENASYDWNVSANTTVYLHGNSYQAIYRIDNKSKLAVFQRDTFNKRTPLSVRALQFRYPNGTVVNASAFEISTNQERTRLTLPNRTGTVAFSVESSGKNFRLPTFRKGSYEVVLPRNADVGIPVLSHVTPGGYKTKTVDGHVHVTWSKVGADTVVVEYYLFRDLLLFGGLFAVLALVAIGGGAYYWLQIRSLRKRREEVGLDVEDEDDDPRDRGPPPGMR